MPLAAPASPGVQVSRIVAAQSIAGSRPSDSIERLCGALPTVVSFFGAATGAAGSSRAKSDRQKGVNT